MHYVPGEHDVLDDDGAAYFGALRQGHERRRLVQLRSGRRALHRPRQRAGPECMGLGWLGADQLAWLENDVGGRRPARRSSSSRTCRFGLYPEWGWGTEDGEQALSYLKRFGSVTVLNGHIHQVMQKVEGNVSFHTAMSTAYPQPKPGTAPAPEPLKGARRRVARHARHSRCQVCRRPRGSCDYRCTAGGKRVAKLVTRQEN